MRQNQRRSRRGVRHLDAVRAAQRRIRRSEQTDLRLRYAVQRDKIAGVGVLQLQRRTRRHPTSGVDDQDGVRVRGFFHIVRGQQNGHPLLFPQPSDHPPDDRARLRVQPRRRLVQNQNGRRVQQRAGDVGSAALAAGELADRAAQQRLQLQQLIQRFQPFAERLPGDAVKRGAAAQVVEHGQRLVERGILEYDAEPGFDCRALPLKLPAADAHLACVLPQTAA